MLHDLIAWGPDLLHGTAITVFMTVSSMVLALVFGALDVGDGAYGLLSIATGGMVNAAALDAGVQSTGSSVGDGVISLSGPGAALSISGDATIGDAGDASLSILNGATMSAANLTIGAQGSGVGAVNISDAGSTLYVAGTLNVGTTLGIGELTIGPNAVVIASKVVLQGQVVLEGGILDPTEIDVTPGNPIVGYGNVGLPGEVALVVNSGTIEAQAGSKASQKTLAVNGTVTGSGGVLQIDSGSTLVLVNGVANTQAVSFNNSSGATGVLVLDDLADFQAPIANFASGDTIYVQTYGAATFSQSGSVVSVIEDSTTVGTLSFTGGVGGTLIDVPCFAAGTRIRAERGEVAVEALRIGDLVWAAIGGGWQPVKWIGHRRVNCKAHPRPEKVWPVRVQAGAFGHGLPARDLWLSPDHALFVNDVLVPVKLLANGGTIRQVAVDTITYYHVELPWHEVVLAEGLAAESYLDSNDRSSFANGGGAVALHPEFAARRWEARWEAEGCAPLVVTGPQLAAARAMVAETAAGPVPDTSFNGEANRAALA